MHLVLCINFNVGFWHFFGSFLFYLGLHKSFFLSSSYLFSLNAETSEWVLQKKCSVHNKSFLEYYIICGLKMWYIVRDFELIYAFELFFTFTFIGVTLIGLSLIHIIFIIDWYVKLRVIDWYGNLCIIDWYCNLCHYHGH